MWVDHAIWWQVYPLGFTGAPIRPEDTGPRRGLDHLVDWLDYVVDLGCSGILLGPVFASTSHGYDTVDHFRIDPRLGDDESFDRLIAAARRRGLRVCLDGVFNHVGEEHPLFRQAMAVGGSDLFRLDSDGHAPVFEGHGALPELDHTSPAVVDLVVDVMDHWGERGVDAWRLDAAYAVDPRFWSQVLPRVRERHPDTWFFGEVIHGDYAGVVAESGMDAVTQYELWKAIWSSLKDANFYELAHALDRHNGFLDSFRPVTFVGNHDVSRIATTVGDAAAVLAVAVLFTVGGTPIVYYGDEQAYRGTKFERFGGDDEVRPPMPATPEELSDLGQWMYRVHQSLIGLRRRHSWLVDARTVVMELDNDRLVYRVQAETDDPRADAAGDHLVIDLDLRESPSVRITRAGEELFRHG